MKLRKDFIDLTGQKFGKLLAINPVRRAIKRGIEWLCKCDCGNQCFAYGGHLRAGERISCGCLASAHVEDSGVNMIMNDYFIKAKKRKREFDLNFIEFKKLIKGNCHYCGTEPSQIRRRPNMKEYKIQIIWNGIDRIDSSKGYTIENCVTCCKYCNAAKLDLSVDEFKNHIRKVAKWLSIDF